MSSAAPSGIIQLTESDLLAAQRFHFRSNLRTAKLWLRLALIWGITAVAFELFVVIVSGPSRLGANLPVFLLVAPLVIAAVFSAIYVFALPRNARRAFAQHKILRAPHTYTIADDALILTGETGTVRLPWPDIHKVRENDALFLAYEWDALYRVFPKRCLPAKHIEEFRRRIGERPAIAGGSEGDDFDRLDTLVRAYLNQDRHEFYETVEDAIADFARHSDETQNRRLLQQMDAFEVRYRDDPEVEFARRYGFDFEPRDTGQTVRQFFDMIRTIVETMGSFK